MGFMDKAKKAVSQNKANAEVSEEAKVVLSAQAKKIEDVLEVLQILPTFEIPADVYMDTDMKAVNFDMQVPKGFDEGQVMYFVSQMKNSIGFYIGLLRKRNEDVAKLASVIDKLQVELNNMRWEKEAENGISIMPTMDDADLENQNIELKLQIRALEDRLREAEAQESGTLPLPGTSVPLEAYERIADELAGARAKISRLEEENYDLKNRIALQEDEEDDAISEVNPSKPLSQAELEELGVVFPDHEEEDELSLPAPVLGERPLEGLLPPPIEYDKDEFSYDEDESLGGLDGETSYGTFGNVGDHDDNPRTLSVYDDDEDDDSLDDLMKALKEL